MKVYGGSGTECMITVIKIGQNNLESFKQHVSFFFKKISTQDLYRSLENVMIGY